MPSDDPNIPDWPGPPTEAEGLSEVMGRLAASDPAADESLGAALEGFWRPLAEAGAPRWSLPADLGGEGCDRPTLVRRYARVAEGSLTAAFVLTQHDAAVRRLVPAAQGGNERARDWLAAIAAGRAFTTVGISHLTTSRRRGPRALVAVETSDGYRLDGLLPWVTAAPRATVFVAGAALDDGRQILFALPADMPGVVVRAPFELAALQASATCEVACEGVEIAAADVLAGPSPDVMATPGAAGTGGLETSALALGQARAALVQLAALAPERDELSEPIEALAATWGQLANDLIAAAEGLPDAPPAALVRASANAFVLRATQAYLTARKGTGFLRGEPAQRWSRQALFFLVWSCPAPVARAALRDFAGLCG
jgi:alkylation response protein AidB-like acyl-CoA dehydrogenase